MRRFMLFLVGAALVLTAAPAPASAAPAACVSATTATFRHTFNGPAGTAAITATRPLCAGQTKAFSLVSYTANGSGLYRYDADQATITAARPLVRLKVTVPPCTTHVYAAPGTAVPTETTGGAAYPTPLAGYAGGSTECRPGPRVTFTNTCTGTTATVTNAPSANVAAVLTAGTRSFRIAPGRSTTLTARKGGTLTFRTNTFTTYVSTWRTPTTPCTTAPAPSKAPAAPIALRPSATASSPAPAPSRSATAAATTPVAFSTTPAALIPDIATDRTLPQTGMGPGSLILIAIGLLMIAGGVLTLTRLIRLNGRPG